MNVNPHVNRKIISGQPPVMPQGQPAQAPPSGDSFHHMMEGLLSKDVKFSKHADMRLSARNIQLDSSQLQRLEQGVAKAGAKGIRDSLVLIDNIALVVNIKNKMVVTALNQQDQVFTNIDGAVIV